MSHTKEPRPLHDIDQCDMLAEQQIKQLEALDDGSGSLFDELYQLWLNTLDDGIIELQDAISKSDIPEVETYSHRLKGSRSNIGAKKLSFVFDNIENLAEQEKLDEALRYFELVHEEFNAAKSALQIRFGLNRAA